LKHSPMLGQAASSQTELRLCSRSMCLILFTAAPPEAVARIQGGLRWISFADLTLIGMRDSLSAPR
jgi:hypothetical protein